MLYDAKDDFVLLIGAIRELKEKSSEKRLSINQNITFLTLSQTLVLNLYVIPDLRFSSKCFDQIYRAQYGAAILVHNFW